MNFACYCRHALAALLLTVLTARATAGQSVAIWPLDPSLTPAQTATELWVENRGDETTLLQVRIFGWSHIDGGDRYQRQQQVVASPPMLRLIPGQRHVIRLVKRQAPAAGQEQAYRVLLDEIPTPPKQETPAHSLKFQMRYSIPLFVYGEHSGPDRGMPALRWRQVVDGNRRFLEISNHGPVHARLSKARIGHRPLTDGLLGYVLPNASYRWPLDFTPPAGALLEARVDNRQQLWRGAAG